MWITRRAMAGLNLQDFEDCLPSVRVGRGYSHMQRYQDFRAVFFGHSTPHQGRRVYAQVIDLCEARVPSESDVHDHAMLAFHAGQRHTGKTIAFWAGFEPPEDQEIGEG